jgi:hypothetical protein
MDWLDSIGKKLLRQKQFASVVVYDLKDLRFVVQVFNKVKNDWHVAESIAYESAEGMFDYLVDQELPILLAIQGKGVLLSHGTTHQVREEDFYKQSITWGEDQWDFMARREYVDQYFESFSQQGLEVLHVYLGASSFPMLAPLLEVTDEPVYFGVYEISQVMIKQSGVISQYQYTIENQVLEAEELPAYGGMIALLVDHLYDDFESNYTQWIQSRIYPKLLKTLVGFVLIILMVNSGIYIWQDSINLTLNESVSEIKSITNTVNQTRSRIATLEGQIGGMDESEYAIRLDELARTIPRTVYLTELNIGLEKVDPKTRKKTYDLTQISISGTSTNVEDYAKWVSSIQKLNWLEKIENQSIDFMSSAAVYEFQLMLKQEP